MMKSSSKLLICAVVSSIAPSTFALGYAYVDLGVGNIPTGVSNSYIVGTTPSGATTQGYYRTFSGTSVGSINSVSGTTEFRAVNDNGQVAGFMNNAGGVLAQRYTIPTATLLTISSTVAYPSFGYGISANGTVTGWNDGTNHAMTWTGASSTTVFADYAAPFIPSGTACYSVGVNDNKDHCGFARFGTAPNGLDAAAVYLQGTGYINLGLPGMANGINNSKMVCGTGLNGSGVNNAFTWTQGGGMVYPLGTSLESTATGINSSGWIVGRYRASGATYTTAYVRTTTNNDLSSLTTGIPWGVMGSTPGVLAVIDAMAISTYGDIIGQVYYFKGFGPWSPFEVRNVLFKRTS